MKAIEIAKLQLKVVGLNEESYQLGQIARQAEQDADAFRVGCTYPLTEEHRAQNKANNKAVAKARKAARVAFENWVIAAAEYSNALKG